MAQHLATAAWGPLRDFCIFEERIRQNLENVAALRATLWRRLARRAAVLAALLAAALRAPLVLSALGIAGAPGTKRRLLASLLLFALLAAAVAAVIAAAAAWRRSLAGSQYEDQAMRALAPFSLQLRVLPAPSLGAPRSARARVEAVVRRLLLMRPRTVASGEVTFVRRLPHQLALFLDAYRAEYRLRRALRSRRA